MTGRRLSTLLALAGTLAVAACSGRHGANVLPSAPGAPGSSSNGATGFAYDTSAMRGATRIGPAKVGSIGVDLLPRLQNTAGLLAYARSANDPSSGNYRHFITPAQIGQSYGASSSTYAAAAAYLQSQGLSIATWPQHLMIHATGTQAQMERALHTHFAWYRNATSTFLAPESAPAPPSSSQIVGASHLVATTSAFTTFVKVNAAAQTNGTVYGYSPWQIAAAFDFSGAYLAGYTGKGITTGVIGTGGLDPIDVSAFKAMFLIGGAGTVTQVSATDANAPGNSALGFAPPLPITAPCNGLPYEPTPACNPEDGETQIDTEQLSSLAYDANLRYYLAYNPNDGCGVVGTTCPPGAGLPGQGLVETDAELETAIADNRADVLSLSYGGPETAQVGYEFNASGGGIGPLEFAALASEGIAVFASSGDSGAEECRQFQVPNPDALCVSYPSTDPNVVSVGGTNTPLDSAGRFVGPLTGWGNRTSGGNGGSGGGVSQYFPAPAYQAGAAGLSGSMRNTPDISLEGDDLTGVAVLLYGDPQFAPYRRAVPLGGTSVAAPEAAAMWALVLQACKQHAPCATATGAAPYRLGNPNAQFYKLYAGKPSYTSVFYDVLYGNNAQVCVGSGAPCPTSAPGYAAGTGYDLVTGIGVPYARALIKAVVGV